MNYHNEQEPMTSEVEDEILSGVDLESSRRLNANLKSEHMKITKKVDLSFPTDPMVCFSRLV
ncbi:hypothetical protein K443DRAFT_680721 [Laccaria amethystina LaAM-08-1]|uniref:Unplaced genomic scaffold K443scaffold_132, whole genome shotgun sequence n=1 Tax=Laccaria amethystina LaAM-08-1 TaxID=1095629 RepID=A0A0C9XLZ9_9AGAR|nr:hypothetical protein K443DRAFT_680721 [Laccaria amethystina LaAM-08-1]